MVERYVAALKYRFDEDPFMNMNANNPARYFYLQGLAAFLSKLPDKYEQYSDHAKVGEHFMANAIIIAPKIARRDIVMASTYIYLIQKEAKLCQ